MTESQNTARLRRVGICPPQVLLPEKQIDLNKWAVIACDQYTSQQDYWERVARTVGGAPSTLNLIFPEIYLERPDAGGRIERIHQAMASYLADGVLAAPREGFIYIERQTAHAPLRRGLLAIIDLEKYDYNKGSTSPVRATEGTILSRIPPRQAVRRGAALELPHVMLLIDDPERRVIEPLAAHKHELEVAYDTDLMLGGGHVTGFWVEGEAAYGRLADALEGLWQDIAAKCPESPVLYAVGDGNHSLATAKACYEELKKALGEAALAHPARWAMVEINNVHDEGLSFAPINRVLFHTQPQERLAGLLARAKALDWQPDFAALAPEELWPAVCAADAAGEQALGVVADGVCGLIRLGNPGHPLAVGAIQQLLDETLQDGESLDYVHGIETTLTMGIQQGNMSFLLPAMDKHALFPAIEQAGALPRKTFSMGEADEKRFYLECRRITA